jgi:hypothetical protein
MGKAQYLTRTEPFLRVWHARCVWEEAIISCPETHNLVPIVEATDAYNWAKRNGRYALTAMA